MARRQVVAVIAATTLAVGGCGGADPRPSVADQVPRLEAVLEHVDAALAAHRLEAARGYLRRLRSDVVEARDAGTLADADAARVLAAVSRLVQMLPAASPTPSTTPTLRSPSVTGTSTPSGPKSSAPHPKASASTAPTPSATPSSSPTATSTATTSSTPTDAPTRDASPTASPTPTP